MPFLMGQIPQDATLRIILQFLAAFSMQVLGYVQYFLQPLEKGFLDMLGCGPGFCKKKRNSRMKIGDQVCFLKADFGPSGGGF